MGRKGDSKSKTKTKSGPASKSKNNSVTELVKGKEAPSVKAGVETNTNFNKTQKKR